MTYLDIFVPGSEQSGVVESVYLQNNEKTILKYVNKRHNYTANYNKTRKYSTTSNKVREDAETPAPPAENLSMWRNEPLGGVLPSQSIFKIIVIVIIIKFSTKIWKNANS